MAAPLNPFNLSKKFTEKTLSKVNPSDVRRVGGVEFVDAKMVDHLSGYQALTVASELKADREKTWERLSTIESIIKTEVKTTSIRIESLVEKVTAIEEVLASMGTVNTRIEDAQERVQRVAEIIGSIGLVLSRAAEQIREVK